jgi:ApaG protein
MDSGLRFAMEAAPGILRDRGAAPAPGSALFLCYHRWMPEGKKYSVAVTAHSTYLPDQSDEDEDRYVFAYTIRITNNGEVPAQLVSRHWIITDADNQVQEVRGMGVVGEQPVLKPGDTFEYSSGSSIPTAVGTMRGSYQLVAEDGTRFEASIPEFTLSVPRVLH